MDLVDGVWPTMITAFTDEDSLDEAAMEALVEWYIERGVTGLFRSAPTGGIPAAHPSGGSIPRFTVTRVG